MPFERTVLLACPSDALALLQPLVASIARVVSATSVDEALARGAENVDAIVCTLAFDESRMLDFVREAHDRWPGIPFVCCRILATHLAPSSVQAATAAALNLGALEFLDYESLSAATDGPRRLVSVLAPLLAARRKPPFSPSASRISS